MIATVLFATWLAACLGSQYPKADGQVLGTVESVTPRAGQPATDVVLRLIRADPEREGNLTVRMTGASFPDGRMSIQSDPPYESQSFAIGELAWVTYHTDGEGTNWVLDKGFVLPADFAWKVDPDRRSDSRVDQEERRAVFLTFLRDLEEGQADFDQTYVYRKFVPEIFREPGLGIRLSGDSIAGWLAAPLLVENEEWVGDRRLTLAEAWASVGGSR